MAIRERMNAVLFASDSIGKDLLRQRLTAGLQQTDVARAAGIRPETLSRVEHGRGNPTVGLVKKVLLAIEHLGKRS